MKTKRQAKQERTLQSAKNQYKQDKADLKSMHLWSDKKLTRHEKKRLHDAVKKAKRDGRLPKTAQETIPYKEMCRDGICIVNDHYFTKQIEFLDINYQLGATRSHTNTIPQEVTPCGRLGHIVLKMGGFRHDAEAITYALMSGMKG